MYLVRSISAAVAAAMLALPGVAGAVSFGGTYVVSANGSDPGLVVQVAPGTDGFATPDLAVGGSYTFDLFRIWTDEASVNVGEDDLARPISVAFSFSAPGAFGGSVTGSTVGVTGPIFDRPQNGSLSWNGPVTLNFGTGGTGKVTLALTDADFN